MLTPELQLRHEINTFFLLCLGQQWSAVRPGKQDGSQLEGGISARRASAWSPIDGAKVASGSQTTSKSLVRAHVQERSLSAHQQGRTLGLCAWR